MLAVSFALFGVIVIVMTILSGFPSRTEIQFDCGKAVVRSVEIEFGALCQIVAGCLMIVLEICAICF